MSIDKSASINKKVHNCGRCGLEVAKKDFTKHWRISHKVQAVKHHTVLAEGKDAPAPYWLDLKDLTNT